MVGACGDSVEALQDLRRSLPDLLFLDIHMPGLSGFDLLADLPNQPLVVFTTAYDRYALEAFQTNAYWTVIAVGTEVLNGAEALVSVHPLRTLDAIHVASAQLCASRSSIADLIFVSADKRQTDVASRIGLMTRHVG